MTYGGSATPKLASNVMLLNNGLGNLSVPSSAMHDTFAIRSPKVCIIGCLCMAMTATANFLLSK